MNQQPAVQNQAQAQAQAPNAAGQDGWDEARLEEAMKRLKLLHIKSTPDVMFAAFMNSVNEAQANIKEVTDLMRDEKSREIFAQAKKRKEEEPTGIKTWEYYDHPDWFRMDEE
ncbi:hypothetical protein LB505_000711 [Fusarium chuoi]|nr:hypothetical protein LB505_000711 [Fusarium chuoi]